MKVLLLDDDNLSLEFMRIFLESEGATIKAATTCSEAREFFEAFTPDVVVVDVELEDGSGIDFAKYVKSKSNVRVILASGHSVEHIRESGVAPEIIDVILTKPIELQDLKLAIFPEK
jgi:DNA-binding response OmpR family regulator